MKRFVLIAAAFAAVVFAVPALAADIGVVFMHGKWGTPLPKSPIGPMVDAMKRAGGIIVEAPDMPWSRDRAYDKDVEGALAEIDAAVERLKKKGAERIVVGGQSLGANMALAYAARRGGVAGVVMAAPGHTPEAEAFRMSLGGEVARARKLIADGKGDAKDKFSDLNQGRTQTVPATARAYVSWLDPEGPLVMPKNAAMLKDGTPLMWVIGESDGLAKQGEAYAFARAPKHPKNVYKVVKGGHADTPTVAAGEIVAWIKSL